jgi:hypothetical protein
MRDLVKAEILSQLLKAREKCRFTKCQDISKKGCSTHRTAN